MVSGRSLWIVAQGCADGELSRVDIAGFKGLFRWLRYERGFRRSDATILRTQVKTNYSSPVFSGDSPAWVKYLDSTRDQRYDNPTRIDIILAQLIVIFFTFAHIVTDLHSRQVEGLDSGFFLLCPCRF